MKVNETLNDGLKRGYELVLTADELEAKVDQKLEVARADFQMKGFRKGKAPKALMKKVFGKSVLGEAMQEGIDDALRSHFEEKGDRPAMQPEVKMTNDEWKEGDDMVVSVSYECLPDVPKFDFKTLQLERLVAEVEDEALQEALENLASSTQSFKARRKDSKARDGDQVTMDFVGKVDGEAFEGGTAEDFALVLGSGQFIPGFEDQLVGVKIRDEPVEITATFPAEYQAEDLAGKEAVFTCTIKEVAAPQDAPIDDDLAKKYGADDLDALKAKLSERLVAEYAGAARTVMKRGLLDQLDERIKFDLPPSMVDAEANRIAHQLHQDENPDVEGHDHTDIETTDEHRGLAERRVRLGLLLAEIGANAEITVTDQEVNQAIFRQAQQYPGQEKAFFDFIRQNDQMLQQMRAPIFEDKVVDYIVELAEVEKKLVSKDYLQKAIEALDEA